VAIVAVGCYIVVGLVAVRYRPRISAAVAFVVLAFWMAVNHALVVDALAVAVAWMLGHTIRRRRQFTESQRAEAMARAVQEERLRIAREMHDVITHSLGVITMQASVGNRVIDRRPDEARKALSVIEEIGRGAMIELRGMLGTLRHAGPGPGNSGVGPALRGPAPGLADLDRLVEQSREAGVRVEVEFRGEQRPAPLGVDLSAFRIVQEALTNVARHAGVDCCQVVVTQDPGELTVEIIDAGRGGAPSTGYGLQGMRERVTLFGGTFDAGPRPSGGFAVTARFPLPADAQ